MSELIETMANAIWENQRARIKNQDGVNARATWRDEYIPEIFWIGYTNDARAAIAAIEAAGFVVAPKESRREPVNGSKRLIDVAKLHLWLWRPKASSEASR